MLLIFSVFDVPALNVLIGDMMYHVPTGMSVLFVKP
jgi:hypothetical protein